MYKIKTVALILIFISSINLSKAEQSEHKSDGKLRINEIMPINTKVLANDYGEFCPWVEIYNTTNSSINVGGYYITKDKNYLETRKTNNNDLANTFRIPRGDVRTIIPPKSYLVIWASGPDVHGWNHLSYGIEDADYLAIYDQSATEKVCDIKIVAKDSNVSYGWDQTHGKKAVDKWVILKSPSPSITNNLDPIKSKNEVIEENDPKGVWITIISMGVVFTVLLLLFTVFKIIGGLFEKNNNKKNSQTETALPKVSVSNTTSSSGISGEVLAVIFAAMHQHCSDLHVKEAEVVTINKVAKFYSPWNSKVYSLRQLPNKK